MNIHQHILFLCFLLFGIFVEFAEAQSGQAALRVFAISEDDGNPIVAANVLLTVPEGDTLRAGATDNYGFIQFSGIDAGEYEVHVSYIGFNTHRNILALTGGETTVYRAELETGTEELGELIVSVRQGAVQRQAGLQRVTPEDLSRIPTVGPGGDLTMYLQTLPSVVTTGDRGGELHIRGGTPSQNLVLVENMPILKPFHISNLFSAFPQDVISTVDVYAGGFGAKYTGATSAVLDVNIRQGNMREFQTEAAVSPYITTFRAEGPIKREKQSFLIMGRYSLIEEFGPSLTGEDIYMKFSDMIARYSFNWPGLVCNLTGLYTTDSGRINPDRDVRLTWSNLAVGGRCLGFAEGLSDAVDLTFGYSRFYSTEAGLDFTNRESSVDMGYMKMDNRGDLFNIPMDYGMNLEFIKYNAYIDDPFAQVRGDPIRYTGLSPTIDKLSTIASVYANLDWKPVSNWTLRPGIASQMNMTDRIPTFEPRVRMMWRPTGSNDLEFSLAAGRYIQMYEAINDERDAANVFYVYKPVDDEDPNPVSLHGILGYRQQVNRIFGLSIEAYVKTHENIPVARWNRETQNTLATGLADSFTYGADIQVEFNFRNWYISSSYGLAEVTYEAPSDELVAWIDRPIFRYNPAHDRRHQFNVTSSLTLGKFTLNTNWQYASGGPFTKIYAFDLALRNILFQDPETQQGRAMTLYSEPYDGQLPSFHRLDVSLNRIFDISPGFEIETRAGAINTYDIRNVFYFDVNTLKQVDNLPLIPYASLALRIK